MFFCLVDSECMYVLRVSLAPSLTENVTLLSHKALFCCVCSLSWFYDEVILSGASVFSYTEDFVQV